MHRTFVSALIALLPALATTQEKEFKGSITDDMCGATHMMEGMTAKQCADECVKGGAKYALYVPAQDKVYALDKQQEAAKFSGEAVIVKGTLSQDGKAIAVRSMEKEKKTSP